MDIYLLLAALACNLYITGVHWTFQLVHYPLYTRVGAREFQDYQVSHQRRILWSVRVPRLITLGLTGLLIQWHPWGSESWELWATFLSLMAATLISFQFIHPLQKLLSQQGYSTKLIKALTRLHWVRTILTTLSAGILLVIVARLIIHSTQ